MTIVSNGLFQVRVEGEVVQAGYSTAWGLTRLSQVFGNYLTPYSSIRDVKVVSNTGIERHLDLFRALRFGEKEQDPYLRPGETVIIGKRDRSIQLLGEVRRPGIYQPLPNEGLKELIEYYGDGFTVLADRYRVRIQRLVTDGNTIAESAVIDLSRSLDKEVELRDMDTLAIPSKTDRLPVVFIEGAIMPDSEFESSAIKSNNNSNSQIQKYSKFSVPVKDGETLYEVLLDRGEQIYPDADLPHAYLVRRDPAEVVPVDLETLLFAYKTEDDIVLKPYDHLVIPFRHFSVVVTGAVHNPGTYSYAPNKTYKYYIDVAGGIDPEKGAAGSVRIFDRAGGKLPKDSFLDPEGKVHVPYSFTFYFFRYFPVVTSATLAIITGLYYLDNISK